MAKRSTTAKISREEGRKRAKEIRSRLKALRDELNKLKGNVKDAAIHDELQVRGSLLGVKKAAKNLCSDKLTQGFF
jgi:hypothetical protein